MNFGDSYDDFSYMENRMDINFFNQNFSGWLQLEYSDPPELGFPIKDIRKYRLEYKTGPWSIKYGDIYQVWGRGLLLAQLDDQGIDFDNSVNGIHMQYDYGKIKIEHMNGTTKNAQLGSDLRSPEFEFTHEMDATNMEFDLYPFGLGFSFLQSDEVHQNKLYGPLDTVNINHRIHGGYISWYGSFMDIFAEYVDKQSKEIILDTDFSGNVSESFKPLKNGYATYVNTNFYFGSISLFTEYKRYSFDRLNPVDSDYVINNYGNRIDYQVMPILYREQNHSFLGRAAHQTNANDERGFQLELSGPIGDKLQFVSQYSHLSRNDEWQSVSPASWNPKRVSGLLPSNKISALPYKENYNELSGYLFDDKLMFKISYGQNEETPKVTRYYHGLNETITENFSYSDSIEYGDGWYFYNPTLENVDTVFNTIETSLYQIAKSQTFPLELTYTLNNGYSIGISFAYQERKKQNIKRGNASGFYNYADSSWILNDNDNPSAFLNESTTLYPNSIDKQINRMINLSFGKASTWAFTINYDWTNIQEVITKDPNYTPLEAILYGDMAYFKGERENALPNFIQNKWVAIEFSYNISSTQRISMLYGSMQGGLVCSNGICRMLQPFNDGLKVNYSAIF